MDLRYAFHHLRNKEMSSTCLLIMAMSLLFLVSYLPIIQIMIHGWLTREEYSHAFLILPIIANIAWRSRAGLSFENGSSVFSILFMIVLIFIYLFALFTQVQTILYFSMLLTIICTLIYLFGLGGLRVLLYSIILLVLLIPVPEQLYILMTFPLQLKVSQISEIIIQWFGLPILREGNILTVPGMRFEVVEACSGMRSVIALMTLGVIMGYYFLKNRFNKAMLVAASIPVAILINILRLIMLVAAFVYFGIDLSHGTWHTAIGLLTFFIAFSILFLLNWIFRKCEH